MAAGCGKADYVSSSRARRTTSPLRGNRREAIYEDDEDRHAVAGDAAVRTVALTYSTPWSAPTNPGIARFTALDSEGGCSEPPAARQGRFDTDGSLRRREGFADKAPLDRVIGVAAHEGQLFGWPNQALGLFTALGLIPLALSAAVRWRRRRPAGVLGAPAPRAKSGGVIVGLILTLGMMLPLLGLSLLLVLALERGVFRRCGRLRRFFGPEAAEPGLRGSLANGQ